MPWYSFSVSQSNRATGVAVFFHSVAFTFIRTRLSTQSHNQWEEEDIFIDDLGLDVFLELEHYWEYCRDMLTDSFMAFREGVHVIGQQLMFIIISSSKDCQFSQRCEKTLIEHFFDIFNFISHISCYLQLLFQKELICVSPHKSALQSIKV